MRGLRNSVHLLIPKNLVLSTIYDIEDEEGDSKEIGDENNSKISFSELSDNIFENDDNNYMEKQLSLLLEVFLTTYSKKTYSELIKDIEEKEILLHSYSIMSFKIMILKVKCLLKILLIEYNNLLRFKNDNFHEIDNIIQQIQNEFKKISNMTINNNPYEYEILTQVYCKFLYLLSKISLKKEDNIKSLGFILLGINMLKIFMLRRKKANDIQTYKIYSKLLLLLINTLIGDNNYEDALLYCRLLLKIIEVSQKCITFNNNENKISVLTIKKFIKYAGYAFLYIGCCLEQLKDNLQALEAYKHAQYFLDKGSLAGNPFKNMNIVSINNSCNYLAMELFEKLKLKYQKEQIERIQRQNKLEKLKKLLQYQLLQNKKQIKLKLISQGYIGDPFKYNKLEQKVEKLLFPANIQNDLDKIDDELMSFVLAYYNKNKDKSSSYKKLSLNSKKIMSRYELYNILMSKDFRDFCMKNKKLQFNNPKKGSESISTIQRYLNKQMEINSLVKQRANTYKKSMRSLDRINNYLNLQNKDITNKENDTINAITFPTTCPTSYRNEEKDEQLNILINKNYNNNNNNKNKFKYKLLSLTNKEGSCSSRNRINTCNTGYPFIRFSKKFENKSNSKKKKKYKNFNELECDFERKNFDKNLMTKNYLNKYSYYEKLSNKELKVQKALLTFRSHNTLYNAIRPMEKDEGKIISKEEIINRFLIINDKVKEKTKVVVKDEELEMFKDSFISGDDNKLSIKMKSVMSRVISKYILDSKKKKTKRNYRSLSNEEIQQINEKNLLELNYSIKKMNNKICHIKELAGNKIYDKFYN